MRPRYGDAFKFDRLLTVFFYTSNPEKLLQARLMFGRSGYSVKHYRGKQEPYEEDYSGTTENLLRRAIQQVSEEFRLRSIFFVEDTSVRIEVLSGKSDFPGLRTKEWFEETSFEELDRQLTLRGGDRRATVKSDIALHIPSLSRPLMFHGETEGAVARTAPRFLPSVPYPWLTPYTFNGWFIPNGSNRRLGEMEFEESLEYDFRAKSLTNLISRLEELDSVLNLPPGLYTVRRREQGQPAQLSLIPPGKHVLLVIGPKCSGKTTFGDHLIANYEGAIVIEASSLLRTIAEEKGEQISDSDSALQFLKVNGMDIVAKRIVEYVERSNSDLNVITGLRTVEELLLLSRHFEEARIVAINCDSRIRFERHIRRARDAEVNSFRAFEKQDAEQFGFGALRVATEVADIVIENDGLMEQYHDKIDDALTVVRTARERGFVASVSSRRRYAGGELRRCLRALALLGKPATCDEISLKTEELGSQVRRYNTNRALKAAPEFADRITRRGQLLSYRLSPQGRALLDLFDALDQHQ